MPIYDYKCPQCESEFEVMLSLESYSPLRVCPSCNSPSPRKLSAPRLQILKAHERTARERNEKAIFDPVRITRRHECSDPDCGHQKEEKSKGAYQQIRQGSRPWMLG